MVTSLGAAPVTGAVRDARAAGVTAVTCGGWRRPARPAPAGLTSRSLADFGTEIIRLTEVAGPGHVAIGTDLDGNYRPVLTSYHQLADLAGLLRDHGLPAACIRQVLGGNAAGLLNRTGPRTPASLGMAAPLAKVPLRPVSPG